MVFLNCFKRQESGRTQIIAFVGEREKWYAFGIKCDESWNTNSDSSAPLGKPLGWWHGVTKGFLFPFWLLAVWWVNV